MFTAAILALASGRVIIDINFYAVVKRREQEEEI